MKKGFTFIELLIALAVIAICFLPLARMFSTSLEQLYATRDITTARYLAQEGMEKAKNLGYTQAQFLSTGDVWEPGQDKGPLEMNGSLWRVLRRPVPKTDPLEVRVIVYQLADKKEDMTKAKPMVEVVTLISDLDWAVIE